MRHYTIWNTTNVILHKVHLIGPLRAYKNGQTNIKARREFLDKKKKLRKYNISRYLAGMYSVHMNYNNIVRPKRIKKSKIYGAGSTFIYRSSLIYIL